MQVDTDRLKAEIQYRGWNSRILSEKTGISTTWVNDIVRGKVTPTAKTLKKIVDALKLEMREILILKAGKRR